MMDINNQAKAGQFLRHPKDNLARTLFNSFVPRAEIVTQIEFPDVSFYQGTIEFARMGNVAIFRMGQNLWIDSQFERNRAEAEKKGMTWGGYWFYDDRVPPLAQANKLFELFNKGQARPRMEIFVDWETSYGGAYGTISHVHQFMQNLEAKMPWIKLGIYTGYYWWTGKVKPSDPLLGYFKTKPLWLAWYTGYPQNVIVPYPWTKMTFWQYGTPPIGFDYGVETAEIDMNYFNGSISEFEIRYGSAEPPIVLPPPPTGETNMLSCKTLVQVKVFNSMAANAAQTRLIGAGVTFNALSQTGDWLMISTSEWVNVMKGGTQAVIIKAEAATSPPPVVVMSSDLIQVNFDYDQQWTADNGSQFHVSRPTRNKAANRTVSLPATANFRNTLSNVPMTEDIQYWIHTMNMQRNPSLSEAEGRRAFYSLFRDDAYATNFAGTTTRADYINGTNLDNGLPMLIPMGCGGTIFKQIGSKVYNGEGCWIIETIDDASDYRQYTPETHPHLFYTPSNSARRKIYKSVLGVMVWTGKWDERFSNPFHQYGNPIIPLLTHNTNTALIPKWRCHTGIIMNYARG